MTVSIVPFMYYYEYGVVICVSCRYAVTGNEAASHLKVAAHRGLSHAQRRTICDAIQALPGLRHTQEDLAGFPFPPPHSPAIPHLAAPKQDGLGCGQCPYVVRAEKNMKLHCKETHGWQNPRRRGRQRGAAAEEPWETGVVCQRFFVYGKHSGYFRVEARTPLPLAKPSTPTTPRKRRHEEMAAPVTPGTLATRQFSAKLRAMKAKQGQSDNTVRDKLEPNPWLKRVGWARHLADFHRPQDQARLQATVTLPGEEEPAAQLVWASWCRVAQAAHECVLSLDAGAPTLFQMNRDSEKHVHQPFDAAMDPGTRTYYFGVVGRILLYLCRSQAWTEEGPLYKLTPAQAQLFDALTDMADEAAAADTEPEAAAMDGLCLALCIALLDHAVVKTAYESAIVSGLAVMAMDEAGGWVALGDHTKCYSAVIKVARILVVYEADRRIEQEVRRREAQGATREEAEAASTHLHDAVQAQMNRFMIRANQTTPATPMDWLFSTRTYGFAIIYQEAAAGHIDWEEDRLTYKAVSFSMPQLREAVAGGIEAARALLGGLLLLEADEAGATAFPAIPWATLEDDFGNRQLNHSFLDDVRNTAALEGAAPGGDQWLQRRTVASEARKRHWYARGEPGRTTYRAAAVEAYRQQHEQFRRLLLALFHITAGQPARTTELLGVRICNTRHGEARNVFVHRHMVCLCIGYHKRFVKTNTLQTIFRYLPREVGALYVWYVWLVRPFWCGVEGALQGADRASPFLFGQALVGGVITGAEAEAAEAAAADEHDPWFDSPAPSAAEEEEPSRFRRFDTWSSEAMRGAVQAFTKRFLGVSVHISAWRHMAIAISRKYLATPFEDEAEEEDGILDQQAGHSTHIAEVIYARELSMPFGRNTQRDKFYQASVMWHRFLLLGQLEAVMVAGRRLLPVAEQFHRGQVRRLRRLQEVDLLGHLRAMLGQAAADFRPGQEAVVRAICRGQPRVLQIVGTGGGKSLSFMLPAYAGHGGVTVVVLPLVALRDDLVRRCEQAQVRAAVWRSSRAEAMDPDAALVFTTPESVAGGGFQSYMQRLRTTGRLDRIVVDECHMMLEVPRENARTGARFREAFAQLGPALAEFGCPLVFLTATLPPRDEAAFFDVAGVAWPPPVVFRSPTTRAQIRYVVRAYAAGRDDEPEARLMAAVQATLAAMQQETGEGQWIVYARTRDLVEALAAHLGCPAYHATVGSEADKQAIMRRWMRQGQTIVATNALGVGLDVPGIRGVLHAGLPRRLTDFAQESGRAGRDGQPSVSVILHREDEVAAARPPPPAVMTSRAAKKRHHQGEKKPAAAAAAMDEDMARFVRSTGCRRAVLDEVMDGDVTRTHCGAEEAACDICGGRPSDSSSEEEDGDEETVAIRGFLAQSRQAGAVRREEAAQQVQEEEESWVQFTLLLPWLAGRCWICWAHEGGEAADSEARQLACMHEEDECPRRLRGCTHWGVSAVFESQFETIFRARLLARYSGCMNCGIPFVLCDSWQPVGLEGASYRRAGPWQCQYAGRIVRQLCHWSMVHQIKGWTGVDEFMVSYAEKHGWPTARADSEDVEAWNRFLGQRVLWAGHETSHLFRLCGEFSLVRDTGGEQAKAVCIICDTE